MEETEREKKREISYIVNNFQTVLKVTHGKPSRCKLSETKPPLSRTASQTPDHFLNRERKTQSYFQLTFK